MPLYDHRGKPINSESAMIGALQETVQNQQFEQTYLKERLAELELAMEDQGWRQLITGGMREFSRAGLAEIQRFARLMYLKNPVIKRGVEVQALYVWGRGVTIQGRDELVNEVIQDFLDDPKNQRELTSHVARKGKEIALQIAGNLFFVFFSNVSTGEVQVRTINTDEVREIVFNPDDGRDPWLYLRQWVEYRYSETGAKQEITRSEYYPDWGHEPSSKPPTMYGKPVNWDTPVYHVKVGGLDDMSMGVPEVYAAIDWAKAWKEGLEDFCTITRAFARFAWNMQTVGGNRGVQNAKNRMSTTLASGANETTIETNPSPLVGSMFVHNDKVKLDPIKTAGSTTSPEDMRRVFLMSIMAMGLPETFYGDASVGTLATAKSLDRPTELKMLDRQTLWSEVLRGILDYVIDRSSQAPSGKLAGKALTKNKQAGPNAQKVIPLKSDPKAGEEIDRFVEVSFPKLLEHDVAEQIKAITTAATLGNTQGQLVGTLDLRTISKLFLSELLSDPSQIDELLDMIVPPDGDNPTGRPMPDQDRIDQAKSLGAPPDSQQEDPSPQPYIDDELARSATATERAHMVAAVNELREAIRNLKAA